MSLEDKIIGYGHIVFINWEGGRFICRLITSDGRFFWGFGKNRDRAIKNAWMFSDLLQQS